MPSKVSHTALSYRLRNIKLSILISHIPKEILRQRIRKLYSELHETIHHHSNNFFVYKDDMSQCIYTFFFAGHINVTKIISEDMIRQCVSRVRNLLQLEPETIIVPRTDNITVSGAYLHHENSLNLFNAIVFTKRTDIFRKQNYNNMVFPNAFLGLHTGGTIILSKRLKYSLVGCKTLQVAELAISQLENLIKDVSRECVQPLELRG